MDVLSLHRVVIVRHTSIVSEQQILCKVTVIVLGCQSDYEIFRILEPWYTF